MFTSHNHSTANILHLPAVFENKQLNYGDGVAYYESGVGILIPTKTYKYLRCFKFCSCIENIRLKNVNCRGDDMDFSPT